MTTPELKQGEQFQEQSQVQQREQEAPKEPESVIEEQSTSGHTPGDVTAQVSTDDSNQQAANDSSSQVITVTIPATTQQLDDWSKGSPDNSLTWFAFFWIRMIKKALLHGYRVVTSAAGSQQMLFY